MKKQLVYLDYASTTPIDEAVLGVMTRQLKTNYGNPSSLHTIGQNSKKAISQARQTIAKFFNCGADELIFTSGGTEADNLAILGIARANQNKGKHIIVSDIEHKAILASCHKLEKEGFSITYLKVDKRGQISLEELKKNLRPDTILVSIMYANNEIGAVQPIKKITKIISEIKGAKPVFHTDACQAAGVLPLDVKKLGVDAMTISASKLYGPKGIGCLYIKKSVKIESQILGGDQEFGWRAGTENTASIVALSKALELAEGKKDMENERLASLRDYFLAGIKREIKGVHINGGMSMRLPNNINISIEGVEGESLLLLLDNSGICCSTGSACSSTDLNPSHVLISIGLPIELAHCSVRFTLGRMTTKTEIDYALGALIKSVDWIRKISTIKTYEKR
jgi:cysteine desulfurase